MGFFKNFRASRRSSNEVIVVINKIDLYKSKSKSLMSKHGGKMSESTANPGEKTRRGNAGKNKKEMESKVEIDDDDDHEATSSASHISSADIAEMKAFVDSSISESSGASRSTPVDSATLTRKWKELLPSAEVVGISALTGDGIPALVDRLKNMVPLVCMYMCMRFSPRGLILNR